MFLDILDALLALRQVKGDKAYTLNGPKTLRSKYHLFRNKCILENLRFGFGYLENGIFLGETIMK